MHEKRQFVRRPYEHTLDFCVSVVKIYELKKLALKGITINISSGRFCMKTDYPFEPGHVLRFNNGMG